MADQFYSSHEALENQESFYNVIRKTGLGATPLWDLLNEGKSFKGDPKKGHNWQYRPGPNAGEDNAYAEGSRRADVTDWPTVNLHNELQIFKKTSGITGSQKEAWTIEQQKSDLGAQEMNNRKQMRLDVERAFIGTELAAPVAAATQADVRKMAGIRHYVPANALFDLAGAALSIKDHIDEAFKLMHLMGIVGEPIVVMGGSDAFTDLNHYYADKKLLRPSDTSIVTKLNTISTGWHDNVEIKSNPNFDTDEIMVLAPSLINPILLRQHKSKSVSDPEFDAEAYEDLIEATIQSEDPYAVVRLKNVGRTV